MTTNYLIATWSGKRRNPSKDYLRAQFRQLQKLKHSLTEITVIIPKGSDDKEYYDIPELRLDDTDVAPCRTVNNWLHRPINDRSYGQFLFACRELPGSDFYFLVEDDYLPACDNFDTLLIQALEFKKADYLCGSFGPVPGGKVNVPRHNVGVIRGDALRRIAELNIKFFPNGEGDGQEQEMFGNACIQAGVKIADYSDLFSVPYYDRYLRYFSPMKDLAAPFAPYQLIEHKAFGYHGESGDENSHFLSTMEFEHRGHDTYMVTDQGEWKAAFQMSETELSIYVKLQMLPGHEKYRQLIKDRLTYMGRGRQMNFTE